jgi:hypothetical protein
VAVVLGTAGALVTATVLGSWIDRPPGPLLVLDVTVGVLSCLVTPLMLWSPVGGAVVATPPATAAPQDFAPADQYPAPARPTSGLP